MLITRFILLSPLFLGLVFLGLACSTSGPKYSNPSWLRSVKAPQLSLQFKARVQLDNQKINLTVHLKAQHNQHLRADVFSILGTHEASLYLNSTLKPARLQILLLRQNKTYDLRLDKVAHLQAQHPGWAAVTDATLIHPILFYQAIQAPGWQCTHKGPKTLNNNRHSQNITPTHHKTHNHQLPKTPPPKKTGKQTDKTIGRPQVCTHKKKQISVRWQVGQDQVIIEKPNFKLQLQAVDFSLEVKNPQKAFAPLPL